MRTCFLSSQMNAIGGFSARLNGVRHPAKMSSRKKQEATSFGLSGKPIMTDVENLSRTGPPGTKRGGPDS